MPNTSLLEGDGRHKRFGFIDISDAYPVVNREAFIKSVQLGKWQDELIFFSQVLNERQVDRDIVIDLPYQNKLTEFVVYHFDSTAEIGRIYVYKRDLLSQYAVARQKRGLPWK